MRTPIKTLSLLVLMCTAGAALAQAPRAADRDWPTFGRDKGGMRFSPLKQITPANVAGLKPAWVYHLRPAEAPANAPMALSQTTPLVVNGVMYVTSPYKRVIALDAASGKEIWTYALSGRSEPARRGVEYFAGDKLTPAQIVFGTSDGKLISLDAATGKPNAKFGTDGVVNLNTPEILRGLPGNNGLASPPTIYKNLIITGGLTQESPMKGPAGDVRAFDIHTGKLVWTFRTVPQPGEKYGDTWAGDSWKNVSGVNVWSMLTVDTQRGIAYLPLGQPTGSGADRPGDNLFSSSLVAVDANTGKYLWHFQLTHHDIFDYDAEVPPVLFDVKQNGKTIPAVAAMNKTSFLFILDRVTGKPLYGVEERPVPQNPAQFTSPTQPFPLKPRALARTTMTMDDIATVTPQLEAECKRLIAESKTTLGGVYYQDPNGGNSARFPGSLGGPNWGSTAFNPDLGYLFVGVSNLGGARLGGKSANRFKEGETNMMCQKPPWGALVAVDVNTAEVAWEVPVGITDTLPADKQNTGRPMLGGPIATASGLLFIGATDDARFRAFEAKTGKELWTYKLKGAAHSVPSTYMAKDGKQYVAVTSTGGSFLASPLTDDSITAFALPN